MPEKADKIILTNAQALKKKFGARGFAAVSTAIDALVAADKARGLNTRLVALDDKAQMQTLSAPAVTKATDPRQNKRAVDAVFHATGPDYLVLLGSTDVVPHQDLKNPMHSAADEDVFAFGDIAYACEAPYSQKPEDFVGPTRVLGRIPDMTKGSDPAYLIGLLNTAAGYTAAKPAAFKDYFAVTAQVWEKSTRLSVTNTYGGPLQVASVPPKDSNWPASLLQRRTYFFNCHGAPGDPRFFGQPNGKEEYPVALDAGQLQGRLREGTIVAAECCYGGELYGLSATRTQAGLCNTYLANKAYGFFASTTIAYGPAEGNGQADLICQYFLQNVLEGASLGRAALEARQKFVRTASPPDPSDLKTLAQFNLYGDPSLTPVEAQPAFVAVAAISHSLAERVERHDRRRMLFRGGLDLATKEPVPKRTQAKPPGRIVDKLNAAARDAGTEPTTTLSFKLHYPEVPKAAGKSATKSVMPMAYAEKATLPTAYHVLFARPADAKPEGARAGAVAESKHAYGAEMPKIARIIAFIGKEVDGELVSIRKIHSR